MTLIKNDETLRRFMPNVFATAKGETPLFDKLTPWLTASEQWLKEKICGEDTLAEIVALDDMNVVKMLASQIVVSDALRRAIPSLDLVLTPNGFGIVSNTNVAPASKERVERLIASLETNRDNSIEQLLTQLWQIEAWRESEQFEWFTATIYPNLNLVTECGFTEHRWDKYCELREQAIFIERMIAEEYFSHELMNRLRSELRHPFVNYPVVACIRWHVVNMIKGEKADHKTLFDTVNYIREDPDSFPEWEKSETAKLFAPPVFINIKDATGYWF